MTQGETLFGWLYFAGQQLPIPLVLSLAFYLLRLPQNGLALNLVFFCLNFAVVCVVCHRFLLSNLKELFRDFGGKLGVALAAYGMTLGANFIINLFILLLRPDFANANNENIAGMAREGYLPMLVCTTLLVPLTEEVLYRGAIFGSLVRRSRFLGYFVSLLIFSAIHVVGYIGAPGIGLLDIGLSLLQYMPVSLAMAWAYEYTGCIFVPTMTHMFNNLLAMLALLA